MIKVTDHFSLSKKIKSFLAFLQNREIEVILVGGGVRDYIIYNRISNDLDFEFRSGLCNKDILNLMENFLGENKVDIDKFEVLKTTIDQYELEFSRARCESFDQVNLEDHVRNHSDFKVRYCEKLSFKESFKRRDFTMNAIGFKFDDGGEVCEVIDPFNGLEDIKTKTLQLIDGHFFMDPVRFVRLIRFHIILQFKVSNDISDKLSSFNLKKLTNFYLFKEGYKQEFTSFLNIFFQLTTNNKIPINPKFEILKKIVSSNVDLFSITNHYELYFYCIVRFHFSKIQVEELLEIANIKLIYISHYKKLYKLRKAYDKKIIFDLKNLTHENFLISKEIKAFYDLFKLNEKIDINMDHHYTESEVRILNNSLLESSEESSSYIKLHQISGQNLPICHLYFSLYKGK